ncbi:MAG: hypothetical protein J1E63_00930 [Muribaculaceae bacterium]|nr:hypothetical protein [Muribaculaceae bacterium]
MKKKIFSIALAAMAFVALPTLADNAPKAIDKNATAQCCTPDGGTKKVAQGINPFEGLNLTDAQKAQLKQLQETRKAERTAKATQDKEARKAKKEAAKADRKAARKAYLEQIKAILTPEQYVQYLENIATEKSAVNKQAKKGMGDRKVKAGKKGKKGHGKDMAKGQNKGKGNRMQRGARPQQTPAQPNANAPQN